MSLPIHHMIASGPRPVAPFSHAVEADGWVFITGQMPTDPAAPDAPLPEGVAAQTTRVVENLKVVLGGVGLGLEHVTMARIYLTQFERDYAAFNAVYRVAGSLVPAFWGRQVSAVVAEAIQSAEFTLVHDEHVQQGFYPSRVIVARR